MITATVGRIFAGSGVSEATTRGASGVDEDKVGVIVIWMSRDALAVGRLVDVGAIWVLLALSVANSAVIVPAATEEVRGAVSVSERLVAVSGIYCVENSMKAVPVAHASVSHRSVA